MNSQVECNKIFHDGDNYFKVLSAFNADIEWASGERNWWWCSMWSQIPSQLGHVKNGDKLSKWGCPFIMFSTTVLERNCREVGRLEALVVLGEII